MKRKAGLLLGAALFFLSLHLYLTEHYVMFLLAAVTTLSVAKDWSKK